MFDVALTSLESGVTINNRPADLTPQKIAPINFSPLPKNLRETMTQSPEFKPPSETEAPNYREPSIVNLGISPDQNQDDYISKLTAELTQMAQQQGLKSEEQFAGEDSLTEHPSKKIIVNQRIKNFFNGIKKRIKSWLKR